MKNIEWEPDENGMPMCVRDCPFMSNAGDADNYEPECTHPTTQALLYAYNMDTCPIMCYPQMVKIVAAAKALVSWSDFGGDAPEMLEDAEADAREAVTP